MTCIDEKYKDFSKWSHCNGWPAQVKNEKIFQSGYSVICKPLSKIDKYGLNRVTINWKIIN